MTLVRLNQAERKSQGRRVQAARQLAQKTIRGAAEDLGVNANSIVQWEHGALPTPENRAKLAELYGVDEAILFAEYEARLDVARALLRPA